MQLQVLDASTLLLAKPFVSLEQELIEFAYDFDSDLVTLEQGSIISLIPVPSDNKLVLVCRDGTCLVLSEDNNFKICTLLKLNVDAPLKDCMLLNSKLGTTVARTDSDALSLFQLTEELLSARKKEVCGVQFDVTRDNFREPEEVKVAEQMTEHGSVLDDTLLKKFDQQYFE